MNKRSAKPDAHDDEAGEEPDRDVERADGKRMVRLNVRGPRVEHMAFHIRGPLLVQNKFSKRSMDVMEEKHRLGTKEWKKRSKDLPPRKPERDYKEAIRFSAQGWAGFAAPGLRNGFIRACSTCGLVMTQAKLAIFVHADGFDREDGMPLVRIYGEPEMFRAPVKNRKGGPDLRYRPRWRGWEAWPRVGFNGEIFNESDVLNLLIRVGMFVGIGAGRHDSKESNGLGWGEFEVVFPKRGNPGDLWAEAEKMIKTPAKRVA